MPSTPRPLTAVAAVTGLACVLAGLAVLPASAAPTTLFFSEYVEGTSNNKALEIANPTGAAVSLADWDVLLYANGSTSPTTYELNGTVAPRDVFVLAQSSADAAILAQADQTSGAGLWNGDDAIVLRNAQDVVVDSLGQVGNDPGTEWGSGRTSTADNTLRRKAGAGPDTDTADAFDPAATWDGFATDTFGGLGTADGSTTPTPTPTTTATATPTPAQTAAPELRISQVQGSDATSPHAGRRVVVEGVVTSLITRADALDGFFVQEQDAEADGNASTSEGLFVFCRGGCPTGLTTGEVVRVTGAVSEAFGQTQITAQSAGITRTGRAVLPAPVAVPLPASGSTESAATFEALEGMHVQFPTTLRVAESFELARYGQLVLTAGTRDYTYTHVDETPTAPEVAAYTAELERKRIILDDDNNDQNDAVTGTTDEPYPYPSPGLSTTNTFRAGDSITGLRGVLSWTFNGTGGTDAWRVRPVPGATYQFAATNRRPGVPDVGGRVRVASANVLNFFDQPDTTSSSSAGACGPLGTADCRGGDSQAEIDRQLAKTVAALTAADPHVAGLIEIENDADQALGTLVGALNTATTAGTYDYVRTGVIGTDAIKVALAYQPAVVRPVGDHAVLDSTVDPRFVDTRNRPALAQTFEEVATGARFTVVVNHLKSKGSRCGAGDDATDGSGNCDATRTAAAAALADWSTNDPTRTGDPDVLIIGDLNSYRNERPIQALQAAGYTDLVELFGGPTAYSYLFDGLLGYLDHALANAPMTSQVSGAQEWHNNADEPVLLDYDDDVFDSPGEASFNRESRATDLYEADAYRASDHDLLLVGLDLDAAPVADAGGPYLLRKDSRGPRSLVLHASGSMDLNEGDTLTYAWDLDGDGQFDDATGPRVTVPTTHRAPRDHVVAVRVTDSTGLSDVDTAVLSVRAGRGAKG